mgnify:CR=1 FL=1
MKARMRPSARRSDISPVRVFSRAMTVLIILTGLIATASDAFSPGQSNQGAQGGLFQPSQRINADTIVDFPVDI